MKVGGSYPAGWLADVGPAAKRLEELGYDSAGTGEMAHDPMILAAAAAMATERIEIGTLAIAFARAPMVLAMGAWDLQQATGGRFSLSLGSQVKGHIERRFGMPWSAPAPRMRDYIRTLHAIWDSFETGEKPDYVGDTYRFTLMNPLFQPGPSGFPRPRVLLAAVGEGMTRVAGQVADGVLPHGFTTDKYMREVFLPNVAKGLARGGRTWQDIEISGGGFAVFGEDESEIERKLQALRQPISFYGSTRSYHDVWRVHGWEDLGMQLHSMSLQGKWEEMKGVIPEDVLREFAQTSTYDNLPNFVREHREYASRIQFEMPMETPAQRERFQHILRQVQQVETPRVPRELAALDPA